MKLAAGLILFRRISTHIEYLLLQTSYGDNHWTPPKGHLDPGENDITAATRETEEEAGLKEFNDYEIVDKNFTIESSYHVKDKPKRVVYWLGEVKDPQTKVTLSDEHQAFRWVKLHDAFEIVRYDEMKRVLNVAEQFLANKNK